LTCIETPHLCHSKFAPIAHSIEHMWASSLAALSLRQCSTEAVERAGGGGATPRWRSERSGVVVMARRRRSVPLRFPLPGCVIVLHGHGCWTAFLEREWQRARITAKLTWGPSGSHTVPSCACVGVAELMRWPMEEGTSGLDRDACTGAAELADEGSAAVVVSG